MPSVGIIVFLYAVGVLMLVAEIFIPSHGILSVAGVGFLVFAVVKTFDYGNIAGTGGVVACFIFVPAAGLGMAPTPQLNCSEH